MAYNNPHRLVSSDECRRCSATEVELYRVRKIRHHRDIVPAAELTAKEGSGPYCSGCAHERVAEFAGKDRRAQRREDSKKGRNIDTNDCPLIAVQNLTGADRLAIEREAKKLGWRRDGQSLVTSQVKILLERFGVKLEAEMFGAVTGLGSVATVNGMLRTKEGREGDWVLFTANRRMTEGHVLVIRDGKVLNGGAAHDRSWRLTFAYRVAVV